MQDRRRFAHRAMALLALFVSCQVSDAQICPADLDGNGGVDGADLSRLLVGWGDDQPDLTGDGRVDGADLAEMLGSWGDCPSIRQCEGYGVSYLAGKARLYSHESLGSPCYMCTGPGFNGCTTNFHRDGEFFVLDLDLVPGQSYSLGIQCGPNIVVDGVVDAESSCWLSPSCSDGIRNGDETEIDCGGSTCSPCPTCDDGIRNGDEEGVDCGGSDCVDCQSVCNGTPRPAADVVVENVSTQGASDGRVEFRFDDAPGRSLIEFSLDGGLSYPHVVEDDDGIHVVSGVGPGSYEAWARWAGGDCPNPLASLEIHDGPPAPTCDDGIRNQGEFGVDCGGPCKACPPDPCGNIPRVLHPSPTLPTAVIGAEAGHGFAIDLATDLSLVEIRHGDVVQIQSGGRPDFEFFCSCNQIEFHGVLVDGPTEVPHACVDAGDYDYFVRYRKQGNTTDDPGDVYVYSALFTTAGERVDPDDRPVLVTGGANWMRFRHPHAQDGITEAVFDAQHNGDLLRNLDRFSTVFVDGPDGLTISPRLTRGDANSRHPHGDVDNAAVVRIDYMEKGDASPPTYAMSGGEYAGKWGWGNIVTYEITAVTGGSGAQTYNTFQNYVIGRGLDTFGDPRNASAGRATTNLVLPGFGSHKEMEHDAIFTQHVITITEEDHVDDFLEGHHLFHGVRHRANGNDPGHILGEVPIGAASCGDCHFRDGRGSEIFPTPRGPRVAPPVFGAGLLQWIAGRESGLRWDGAIPTVQAQTRGALLEDHGIDPDQPDQISPEDFERLVKYVEFLSVPARSYAAHDDPQVRRGSVAFIEAGCAVCHSPTQKTSQDAPAMFRDLVLRPYTDMKLHQVTERPIRTPPLWGLGRNIDLLERHGRPLLFMHDGRASTLLDAIQSHAGEASGSRAAFQSMDPADREAVIAFLRSL
ncbi:MAG: di-heme oxidoredictase family protein [Planctomycetota bacterium]|nr:di-heme oxidoredictase family protein [Planctomycetota bacterium]